MWEWLNEATATKIGGVLAAIGGLAVGAWQWILKARVQKASTGADVAVAKSEERVYEQMTARLASMEEESKRLRSELDELRAKVMALELDRHRLKLHVADLEHTLKRHGIDPPAMRA